RLELTQFLLMLRPPSFGAHLGGPPGHILGSEQIAETLKSNGTTTQFWGWSADTANTVGIMLACVYGHLLFQANLKPPGTALLICAVVRVGEACFHRKTKICQQHISSIALEPHSPSMALNIECKNATPAPAESDLNGLVQVDDGAVAAHQE